jgi:trk system potassium uptake protein TrkA
MKKIAIIGLGQFGSEVAKYLVRSGAEVLGIDRNIERVEALKDDITYGVCLDTTDIKALMSQNIKEMDSVVLAIGENIEGQLLTAVHLLDFDVKRLVARAVSPQQRIILEKLGIEEIISPEHEAAVYFGESLINPEIKSYLPLTPTNWIAEVITPRRLYRKTLEEADLDEKYDLKLITIKRLFEDKRTSGKEYQILEKPNLDTILEPLDRMVLFGKKSDIIKFLNLNK